MGVQSQKMYKPIPFFLSSAGYGMFTVLHGISFHVDAGEPEFEQRLAPVLGHLRGVLIARHGIDVGTDVHAEVAIVAMPSAAVSRITSTRK